MKRCLPHGHLLLRCHCPWLELCRQRPGLDYIQIGLRLSKAFKHVWCVVFGLHRFSTGWSSMSLNGMAGKCRMCILGIRCDMMRNTCSSTKGFRANKGWCHTSTAKCCASERKVKTSFELCRTQPTFVKQNNDDLILAIQSAGVERGRNGFRKNKSTEKNPESEEDLLQHRTDGTDAFDTLYIGCEKFPQHDFYGGFVGGVR